MRATAAWLAVVLCVGGLPGATVHDVVRDLVAPPVPEDVRDRDGALEVTVRDGPGGPPLSGAHVRALAMIEGLAYLADAHETDAAGLAHLVALPRGEAWLLADAPGRARASSRLVVEPGLRAVTMELEPEHVLFAVVHDEAGAALAGAEIEVHEPGDPLPVGARTATDGSARVGRLAAGPWHVTARAPGYEEESARVEQDGETARVVLRKLGAIVVHVVDEGDAPVAGARVETAGATLWPARSATADAQGNVRIGALVAGSYALRATAGDRVSPIELGVLLARGEEKSVVLHVAPGRFVAVRVTDGEGDDADPVRSASVTLAEGGLSPFPLEATTDAKGRARLGPIAPGSATLGVRAEGFVTRGGVAVADPPPPETRVVLVRAGTLTGHVVDARGYPVDGATIEIVGTDPSGAPIVDDPRRASFQAAHFDAMLSGPAPLQPMGELGVVPGPVPPIPHEASGSGLQASAGSAAFAAVRSLKPEASIEPWVTDARGEFRASPASPGRIRAIVHHPQYVEAQSDLVTLAPGGEAHVEVVMHEGGSLEGTVVDAHDRPVDGARVTVSATRGSLERTTRTATDGTFAFAALPAEVSLTAGVDGDDTQPDLHLTVAVPEGGKKQVTVKLPEARDPLAVTVVDERDFPLDAAQVSASSLTADVPLRTTAFTDRDGATALKRARGLPLRIEVSAPGRAPKVLTTDGSEESLRVALAPAESATGEVVAARGRDAIAGAEVTLYTDLGVRRARTDAAGAFSLGGLAPGSAKLQVRAAGYAPVTRTLAIPDSEGRRAFEIPRVELAEEGAVEGDVVDANGDPVPGARVAQDRVPTWLAVGSTPAGVAVADSRGHFALHELPEGTLTLEAYAPDIGRARVRDVKVVSGRTTDRVRIVLSRDAGDGAASKEPGASGNVAVTLGETDAPVEVVVVHVVEGSEAERVGLAPGDVILAVDGAHVDTMKEARARLEGPVADDVLLSVRRGDQSLTLRVTREATRR
ncbi:MAG TPA: carboxypeptidase regulatory-like domain-containing protein [Polyangiaceae bacterium]